jgi:hypothetical protein
LGVITNKTAGVAAAIACNNFAFRLDSISNLQRRFGRVNTFRRNDFTKRRDRWNYAPQIRMSLYPTLSASQPRLPLSKRA